MKIKSIIVVLAIAGVAFLWGTKVYNSLVSSDEGVKSAWSQVENQYQRRSDLIPNLVATVKGYAEHESETLQGVVEARSRASQVTVDPENLTPEALQEYQKAQGDITSALGRLMVIREAYPELKANENFQELQAQLEGTENRIAVARKDYNDTAREYNTSIRSFPKNIIASFGNFDQKPYFEAEEQSMSVPKVEF